MPREKLVHRSDMVAHLWAHQTQTSARNSQGNFYFDGATIWSYGRHFPIACIVKRKGKTICLMTTRTYGPITGRHVRMVRNAIRGVHPVVACHNVLANDNSDKATRARMHKENLRLISDSIDDNAKKAMRARANASYLWGIVKCEVDNANAYAELFGMRQRFEVPDKAAIEKRIEQQKHAAALAERRARKAREEQEVKARERLARWIAGENVETWSLPRDQVMLRIVGDALETSYGATVPLKHALRILPLIRSGVPYKHNGHSEHVGDFRIDEIDAQGNVKAGCHFITREEIERVARLIPVA